MLSKWTKVMCLAVAAALVCAPAVWSAANPKELRATLQRHLEHQGYLGRFPHGQGLQRGISAYLWDHRHELALDQITRRQQQDAVFCLLVKKGYPGLETLAADGDFVRTCRILTK